MRRSLDRSGTLDLNFDRLLHWTILSFCHFIFFHSVNYLLFIDIIKKKWFCSIPWSLKGYRVFVFYYRTLLKLFNEIHYWEKLMFETPHYVSELYMKKEDLRILRENVLLVVRDYNRLVVNSTWAYIVVVFKGFWEKKGKRLESRGIIGTITASMSVNQLKALEGKLSIKGYRVGELSSNADKIVIGLTSYQTKRKPREKCLHTLFLLDQQNNCCFVIWRTWIVQGENPITGQENPSWFD